MILVDTSVWIDHFRRGSQSLSELLHSNQILMHPMVIGELACGHFKHRDEIIDLMQNLPRINLAKHDEVMVFIETHQLMGQGLGWIDMHLLASCRLEGCPIWTRDKRLQAMAEGLKLTY